MKKSWHSLENTEIFRLLDSNETGLSEEQAGSRLSQYGYNRLPDTRRRTLYDRFVAQFKNLLIYVLLLAAIITGVLGEWIDCGVILGVVIINAIIGIIQEGKAERALEAIRQILPVDAQVFRQNRFVKQSAERLVPGDIVALQAGDKVPADLRLLYVKKLRIDESMLTGESIPSEKSTETLESATLLPDRSCMAFSGTYVHYGQARGIVVATGLDTEIGKISGLLETVDKLETPLLRHIGRFATIMTFTIGVLATVTFMTGFLYYGFSPHQMFMASVGLIVAAIPEGLPAIMTITLAVGVQRMAKRKAVIRRLPAVEALGSTSVICSDKTGTLTKNEMTVQNIFCVSHHYQVTGTGYDPHGAIMLESHEVSMDSNHALEHLLRASVLCNDASLVSSAGRWKIEGDPTEACLLVLGAKAGMDKMSQDQLYPRLDLLPFESENRYMATLHHDHSGHTRVYIKGAPETILEMCDLQMTGNGESSLDRDHWEAEAASLARMGQRVLAIATKPVESTTTTLQRETVTSGLVFLGLVGMIDPPRPEAIEAVSRCQDAGIRVIMITGDHAITAAAIAGTMGIHNAEQVVTGTELENLTAAELQEKVLETGVFARTSPEHKLRIVQALQSSRESVAMTGDGVNDAPALKSADIGIAMGLKGTHVAREASEMVLADDNFASISHAVEEGRIVYDNIKKSIIYVLPTSFAEAFVIVMAVLLGQQLPVTPVQILWINMVTTVTLAMTLAFEPGEPGIMRRPPRNPSQPLLTRFTIWRIVLVTVILVIGTWYNYSEELRLTGNLDAARTVAVNTLVLFEIFYLFNTRFLIDSSLRLDVFRGNIVILYACGALLVLQLLFTYAAPMQKLFATTALTTGSWLRVVAVAMTVFLLVEAEKYLFRRLRFETNGL